MPIHKGTNSGRLLNALRMTLVSAPLACLAAFALALPMPVPRFLVPTRTYTIGTQAALLDAGARAFRVIRMEPPHPPSAADIEAATAFYASHGMPVVFAGQHVPDTPISAYALELSGSGTASRLSLLVDASASKERLVVKLDGTTVLDVAGTPADRRMELPLESTNRDGSTRSLELTALGPGGQRSASLSLAVPGTDEPRILLAAPPTAGRSVIEALYPVRRIGLDELGSAGIYGYQLVVLDGPKLAALGGSTAAALAEYVERGAGSVMVVVDSPDIGTPGDAPALERILPVDLSPRSLARLPDMALVVALDVSGSMYGDKLSVAKAIGLELVGNLKPSDLVGILLFDDNARWLYQLGPVGALAKANDSAARALSSVRAGGGTRMFPALEESLAALEASNQPERRLIVVSDGISAPADFDGIAARAFAARIPISAMAVGSEFDQALLTRISNGSGGRFYRVRDATEVPSLIIEDRTNVSRTVFAQERVNIVDIAGQPAGSLGGMARLGPKPDAVVLFSSEAGDPLLAMRRVGARSTLVYASDIHGRYGAGFLARPGTLAVIKAIIDGLMPEQPPAVTLTETSDGPSLSIRSDYLVSPRAAVADERGTIVSESVFAPVAPGRYWASLDVQHAGRYTALLEDRGRTVARVPFYANDTMGGMPARTALAAADYVTPFWALLPGRVPWLMAFFALSLCSSLLLRLRR